jgi:hypothetical protein
MTWTDAGAIGELLGAIAVVVSLIYLSRQVRENTRAVRTANAVGVQDNFQKLARVLYTDREMGDVIIRVMGGETGLAPADQLGAYAYFFDFLKTAELAHHQFRNGDLDPALWEASLSFYKAYFTTPGFRAYWDERQSAFVPEFREAMSEWLGTPGELQQPDTLVGARQV